MALVTTSPPQELPVSLADAKSHLRITSTTHDEELVRLINAAGAIVESKTGMRLMKQTVTLYLDKFPYHVADHHRIELGTYPVTAVNSIKYIDTDGNQQTYSTSNYRVSLNGWRAHVIPTDAWPETKTPYPDAVEIQFFAGCNQDEHIPQDVKHAILVLVKELFDNGGESIIGREVHLLPNTVDALLVNHCYHRP